MVVRKVISSGRDYTGEERAMKKIYYLPEGTILQGKYCIQDVIGEGGFGITYRAFDGVLKRQVAIKEYYPSVLVSRNCSYHLNVEMTSQENTVMYKEGKSKFINEAEKMALFQGNPQIVYVIDYFETNNTAYIVMEYLEGETLLDLLRRVGRLRLADALNLLDPVMTALCAIHRQGLIHRDISPDNIIFRKNGQPCLLDFGAARDFEKSMQENRGMTVILKRSYAPEEQYRMNGKQGPWTDVYAMAAVFYRCITGNPPAEISERIYQGAEKKTLEFGALVNKRQEAVLRKGLAVFAKDRYQTMEEFQRDLRQSCIGEQVGHIPGQGENELTRADRPQDSVKTTENSARKIKWIPIACGIAGFLIIGVAGSIFYISHRNSSQTKESKKTEVADKNDTKKQEKTKVTVIPETKTSESVTPSPTAEDKSAVAKTPTTAPKVSVSEKPLTQTPTVTAAVPEVTAVPQPENNDRGSKPSEYKTMYVVNCKQSITLRQSPSTSASEICQIPLGSAVSYVETAENGFYKIIYNGKTGYGLAAYLDNEPRQTEKQDTQITNSSVYDYQQKLYVINCRESITLRTAPSVEAGEICQIPLGSAVAFVGESGNGFYEVQYNGQTGYALASYLSGSAFVSETGRTMQVVNCNESITLRKIPDTDGEEICQIPLGATVSFLGTAENGFYMISYNGQTGYSLADYLS